MATMLFALPIKPGQAEAARAFAQECIGLRYAEYDASEQRIGIQVENWYLQRNAAGQFFTIQVEGPDLMSSLGAFISSHDPFDLWFKEQLARLTGIDLNAGPHQLRWWPRPSQNTRLGVPTAVIRKIEPLAQGCMQ